MDLLQVVRQILQRYLAVAGESVEDSRKIFVADTRKMFVAILEILFIIEKLLKTNSTC